MAYRELKAEELVLSFPFDKGTEEVEPLALFPQQARVERAFQLALETEREGYNVYVSGPESVGRTTYTLRKLREKAKEKPVPEDIIYYHDFDEPLKPKYLLLPAGLGRRLSADIDDVLEKLKQQSYRIFESKEYEEERAKKIEEIEKERERILKELTEEAQKHGLGVVFTPAGIQLLPLVGGRIVTQPELAQNPILQRTYEESLRSFEEKFRDYLRSLRELDHRLADELKDLREKVAGFLVDSLLQRLREKYSDIPDVVEFLDRLRENMVRHIQFFVEWKFVEENIPLRRMVESNINLFRLNVVIDNSKLEGAPVVYEEMPTFKSLFGYISYRAEMGILYADHSSVVGGSLHRARGGYVVLRALDVLRNPFLWEALKRVLLHKKLYVSGYPFEEVFPLSVGVSPEPVPFEGKIFLIGDYLTFHLLSFFDPEFNRLFKVKAEFNPVVDLNEDLLKTFPGILKKIIEEEKLKDLSPDGISEVLKYAVVRSGSRRKVNVVFGYITDLLREANTLARERISGEDIRRTIKERVFRSNLVEEKIREMIREGKIIIDTSGRRQGQVNGLSVVDLGDISFGKPTRITASVYPGEKGIIDIEREVELSGPIHSKGVMILSGYLGNRYGKNVPLSLSCTLTFEQSYDEVEGDSASIAELMAILSSLAGVPLRQDLAVTGSLDQLGNAQPVGGIKEKVEGFYKVCKEKGLTGTQGVILPSRNADNVLLDDEVIEDIRKGKFHIYLVNTVDDVIEILTGMRAHEFHRKVLATLKRFVKFSAGRRQR